MFNQLYVTVRQVLNGMLLVGTKMPNNTDSYTEIVNLRELCSTVNVHNSKKASHRNEFCLKTQDVNVFAEKYLRESKIRKCFCITVTNDKLLYS